MSKDWKLRGYVVEGLLGGGASGQVWRARAASSGAPVALKRIVIADPQQRVRAHAEAGLLAALEHPHLVRLHAVVDDADATVLVLDLADAGSLADILAARGRLTPGEVITAVAPVAAALAYVHGEGVVHGDVTPANVLFTADGTSLLADLGVARLTGDDADAESTPAYIDPAVAAGCVPGPPSDVFMLAAVALHALTGAPPWPGATADEALAAARAIALGDVAGRLTDAGAPQEMTRALCRALDPDPHRRGTAADLALDLRHSGRPLAVELAAGRARREPDARPPSRTHTPRHAARPGAAVVPDPSRPPFERPSRQAVEAEGLPPTRLVGPRPRPAIPRPPKRSPVPRAGLVAAAIVAVLTVGAVLWSSAGAARPRADANGSTVVSGTRPIDPASRTRAATRSAHPTRPAHPMRPARTRPKPAPSTQPTQTGRSVPSRPHPSASVPDPPARSGAGHVRTVDWAAVLRSLDRLRATAFATRNPRLLTRVYVPGALLRADTRELTSLVPHGCGLVGARTRYSKILARASKTRAVLTVTASLPRTRLVCRGAVRARARGVPASRLRLRLVRTERGILLAGQEDAT